MAAAARRRLLQMRRTHGMTLPLTIHYLDEADQFAGRVLVVDRGRLITVSTSCPP